MIAFAYPRTFGFVGPVGPAHINNEAWSTWCGQIPIFFNAAPLGERLCKRCVKAVWDDRGRAAWMVRAEAVAATSGVISG